MTRDEVQELLELRRHATGEQFDAQGAKRDAWWDILGDYDGEQVMARYRELVRGGADKVTLPMLTGGLNRTRPETTARHEHGCDHDGASANGHMEWHCHRCGAKFLAAGHERARRAFAQGLAEGRRKQETQ